MMPHIAGIPDETGRLLWTLVRPKFEAYFRFTQGCLRSKLLDNGLYLYPDDSMVSDLNFLWVVFTDVHQLAKIQLTNIVDHDPFLKRQFYQILEGDSRDPAGEFWHKPTGGILRCIPIQEAVNSHLKDVFRTLRNGFVHTHWLYHNLSALDYWKEQGWDTANVAPDFIQRHPKKNYLIYIADSKDYGGIDPLRFWSLNELRILVTPAHILRYHLHLFLNFLLTGNKIDVFGKTAN